MLNSKIIIRDVQSHAADLDAHQSEKHQFMKIGQYIYQRRRIGATALTANQIYALPFFVSRSVTFDRLAIDVNTGDAAKVARLGIYAMDSAGLPSALKVDGGEISVASAAIVTATISTQLTKGWWYLAYLSDGTPTLECSVANYGGEFLGLHATNFAVDYNGYKRTSFAYAALPDPFGTATLEDNATFMPIVGARVLTLD